ncbi:MAG TPA: hypothetical protein PLI27_09760 [Ignavibacteriales bacterium]|nr:hypothetical protein [Ignavibacteriales bacterium]HPD68346.1 hypothetical protein [Ignavibacteriales bacterium]HRR19399.1 hypothetical protein [Ignavibacteriales bacterium]
MKHLTSQIINEFFDNQLNYQDKYYLENHIKQCSECYNLFTKYERIHSSLKSLDIYEAPANFSQIILDNIYKEKKKEDRTDTIVLSSIIGFIFLVLTTLFIILRINIQNSNIITTKKEVNFFTNLNILFQFVKSINIEISNDIIMLGFVICILIIFYAINEIYNKINVISNINNETR